MQKLVQDIQAHIRARYPILYLLSHEEERLWKVIQHVAAQDGHGARGPGRRLDRARLAREHRLPGARALSSPRARVASGGGALRARVLHPPRPGVVAALVGLVETTAARPRHQPHPGAGRTRPESMLSAAAKRRRKEGALGGVAATIAGRTRASDRSANFGDQLARGAFSACDF